MYRTRKERELAERRERRRFQDLPLSRSFNFLVLTAVNITCCQSSCQSRGKVVVCGMLDALQPCLARPPLNGQGQVVDSDVDLENKAMPASQTQEDITTSRRIEFV